MVNDDGSFVTPGRIAHLAAIAIPLETFLAKTPEVLFVLPFERIADSRHAMRENPGSPPLTMHRVLF